MHLRVFGLRSGQRVEVAATSTDYQDTSWRGHAAFIADEDGNVDLDRAGPRDGTYDQVDGMGLLWSIVPADGEADQQWFFPTWPELAAAFEIQVAVTVDGREVANRPLHRQWMSPGVTHRAFRLETEGIHDDLYLPPAGSTPRAPVLAFGGSEGGTSQKFTAALLASHGHPALSRSYFRVPGLPQTLAGIPLEYFAAAARLLARQPGLKPGRRRRRRILAGQRSRSPARPPLS